jgi:hypothetical protein
MVESRTLETLQAKREAVEKAVAHYELRLAQARADLAHLTAVCAIFESGENATPYVDTRFIFKRAELSTLCKAALAQGPMTTRQLASYVMEAKGWPTEDRVFKRSLCMRIVQSLRMQWRRGKVVRHGKLKGVCVWGMPTPALPAPIESP